MRRTDEHVIHGADWHLFRSSISLVWLEGRIAVYCSSTRKVKFSGLRSHRCSSRISYSCCHLAQQKVRVFWEAHKRRWIFLIFENFWCIFLPLDPAHPVKVWRFLYKTRIWRGIPSEAGPGHSVRLAPSVTQRCGGMGIEDEGGESSYSWRNVGWVQPARVTFPLVPQNSRCLGEAEGQLAGRAEALLWNLNKQAEKFDLIYQFSYICHLKKSFVNDLFQTSVNHRNQSVHVHSGLERKVRVWIKPHRVVHSRMQLAGLCSSGGIWGVREKTHLASFSCSNQAPQILSFYPTDIKPTNPSLSLSLYSKRTAVPLNSNNGIQLLISSSVFVSSAKEWGGKWTVDTLSAETYLVKCTVSQK